MKSRLLIIMSVCVIAFSPRAHSATVFLSGPVYLQVSGTGGLDPLADLDLFVAGDLYIDFAPFLDGGTLDIGPEVTLVAGGALSIFSPGNSRTPWPYDSFDFLSLDDSDAIEVTGDTLLFLSDPYNSLAIEATGNIVIGDYSGLVSAPNPPAILLFASGILVLSGLNRSHTN